MPPMMTYSAFHAENVIPGPINFSDRLRIADSRRSIHFLADHLLGLSLKPACASLPLPARPPGQGVSGFKCPLLAQSRHRFA
jgi:hypothetical protein